MNALTELVTLLRFDHLASQMFPGQPEAVTTVREFIVGELADLGFPAAVIENARTAVSELATNAVRYSRSRDGYFTVWVAADPDRVRVTVIDDGPLETPPVDFERPGGWGLRIVGALATDHGAMTTDTGCHAAWFQLATPFPEGD